MGMGRCSNAVETLERQIRESLLENQALSRKYAKRKETVITDHERSGFLETLRNAHQKVVIDRNKAREYLDRLKVIVARVNPDNEEEYDVCVDAEEQSNRNLAKFNIVVSEIERLQSDVSRGR